MSSMDAHFGLGVETLIDKVVVKWPSGTVDTILNPDFNQTLTVLEGASPLANNQAEANSFSVFPNPAHDVLTIKFNNPSTSIEQAAIYDISGRLISNATLINQTIDVKSIATGAYVLVLKDSKGNSYSQKFLKK